MVANRHLDTSYGSRLPLICCCYPNYKGGIYKPLSYYKMKQNQLKKVQFDPELIMQFV